MRAFYSHAIEETPVTPANREQLEGKLAVGDVIDPETGEVYAESGQPLTKEQIDKIYTCGMKSVSVLDMGKRETGKGQDPLIRNSLDEDPTNTHEEALLRIYQRLRPGNPPQMSQDRSPGRDPKIRATSGKQAPPDAVRHQLP